ncbi:MAG: hypothetical protein MJZ32_12780 [Bacteroidaceae bacterium]|nr:hypothetical protein [Bacteroidaceae bacterium]
MASKVKYYVSDILERICEAMNDICDTQIDENGEPMDSVYAGHRPSAVDNHSEMIVVSLSKSLYTHGPYQNAAVYIDIIVKNGQGGIERTYRLQELLDKVNDKFPIESSDDGMRWIAKNPQLVISGDDQLGFTVWRLRGSLFVNLTDRYGVVE